MTSDELDRLLRHHGFELVGQTGGHRKYRNPQTGLRAVVPYHRGRQLPLGTLRSISVGAGIPDDEWHD